MKINGKCIAGWLSLILAGSLLVSCVPAKKKEPNQLMIVTTFYPIYIATINITRDIPDITVINMTQPQTGCLHDYSLSTTDMKTLSEATILVINGGGMETFMDKVILGFPQLKVIDASKNMELLKDPLSGEPNPHVWVSVSGAISQVYNIASEFSRIDPSHAELYRKNATFYLGKLEALRTRMHSELKNIKTREIVTFHEAFPYFAQEFHLKIVAVIEREPGSEPSPKELINLIQKINRLVAKVLFVEPQYSAKTADLIARETGASIFVLDPAVTGDFSYDSYLTIMERNLQTLRTALS